jgi:hypothetical protein
MKTSGFVMLMLYFCELQDAAEIFVPIFFHRSHGIFSEFAADVICSRSPEKTRLFAKSKPFQWVTEQFLTTMKSSQVGSLNIS